MFKSNVVTFQKSTFPKQQSEGFLKNYYTESSRINSENFTGKRWVATFANIDLSLHRNAPMF